MPAPPQLHAAPRPRRRWRWPRLSRRGQRRLRWVALLAILGVAGIAVASALFGLGRDTPADRVAKVRERVMHGTARDLAVADRELAALADGAGASLDPRLQPCLPGSRAMIRAQLLVEFGVLPADAADGDVFAGSGDAPEECLDTIVARGLVALARGDRSGATEAIERARAAFAELSARSASIAPHHHAWLAAQLALARPDVDAETVEALVDSLQAAIRAEPKGVAYRRALAAAYLHQHQGNLALKTLAEARGLALDHMGLAADEALLNASLGREYSGVADLADQLLALDAETLYPHDRARASVARGRVHVFMGERERGLQRFDEAWPQLPWWDRGARAQALETTLITGDSARARAWVEQAAALTDVDRQIYEAWSLLADGDLMASLSQLAELPQRRPIVGYLQGLALVEQRRLGEAVPWLERTSRALPGRIEIEVASARADVVTGDLRQALRKLEGLAEEEPFAPRAWTGLGEAYLAMATELGEDKGREGTGETGPELLKKAHTALLRAVEREPLPAEAMLRLSELWQRQRLSDPDADRKAREWLEKAAETNAQVPRYREALALYLVGLGRPRLAEPMLHELVDELGSTHRAALALAELRIDRARHQKEPLPDTLDAWIEQAEARGADDTDIARARARAALVTGGRRALTRAMGPIEEAVTAQPDDVDSRVLYAEILMALRDHDAAEKAIRQGLHTSPKDRTGRLFLIWARLEVREGEPRQAAQHARFAWMRMRDEQRPTGELLEVVDLASRLFVRKDMGPQALAVTREFTDRVPSHAEGWRLRARTEFTLGETKAAKRSIEKALALDPEHAVAHVLHAQIMWRYGKKQPAKDAYRRAVAIDPDVPIRTQFRKLLLRP